MHTLGKKLALLLADPSISDNEFRSFGKWLVSGGVDDCLALANILRQTLEQQTSKSEPIQKSLPIDDNTDDRATTEIRNLLLNEANLARYEALQFLADYVGVNLNVSSNKKSFEIQLDYLLKAVGPSKLLSAAHQIRNELVHKASRNDWPLKSK